VFGLIAVVFLVLAAGFGFYFVKRSASGPGSSVAGGGGTVHSAPRSQPSISINIPPNVQPSIPGGSVPNPPQGGQLSVSGISENKTIACNDSIVSVSGVSNTVTITGHCVSVTVSGMQNQVTLDTADAINASGLDNQVTYHSGSPQINSGGSNVVQQG
jgi:hypothetical protein